MAFAAEPPIVSPTWVYEHVGDPDLRILCVDDDALGYELGHLPGASYVCWHTDLTAGDCRDVLPAGGFAALMDDLGVGPDTSVVLYGDQMNLWAAYAWWVMSLWGHPRVHLLDGGWAAWARSGLPMEAAPVLPRGAAGRARSTYPVPIAQVAGMRARRADLEESLLDGRSIIVDVRSRPGYLGEVVLGGLCAPLTGAVRGGHIPGAISLPWGTLFDPDTGLLLPLPELARVVERAGVPFDQRVIAYCELGASSALVCLVLGEVLGHPAVSNYDGSWLEWAATIGLPAER